MMYEDGAPGSLAEELPRVIAQLRAAGAESTTVEVKSAVAKIPASTPETLSAFSNGSGGIIILGLDERTGFAPAKGFRATAIRDALAGACADRMQPPLRPDIEIIAFEGAQVVVARIDALEPFHRPCFVKERGTYAGSFIRTGDGDRKLSQYEIDRLIDEHRQPRWDEELVMEATHADLEPLLVDALVSRQRTLRPRLFASGSTESVLQGLRVLKTDDRGVLRPTLAGLLALGNYPQHFFPRLNVSFASYPGTTKAEVLEGGERLLDSVSFVGAIPNLIRDASSAVIRNARMESRMRGVFRAEVPEYPLIAVREAITNALMHRDYSPLARGTQVQVNLFVNRLEIFNPGGLFGTATLGNLGSPGLSSARNQWLSTLLEEIPHPDGGMVAENRGSGYMMMEAVLASGNRPGPVARDDIAFFTLTFPGGSPQREPQKAPAGEQVKNYLASHNTASALQIVNGTGLSRSSVTKHLRVLLDEGRIAATRAGRSKHQTYQWHE